MRMEALATVGLLLLHSACCSTVTTGKVISAVQKFFSSGCVLLIYSDNETTSQASTLSSSLENKNTFICRRGRPIHVLLSSDKATKNFLRVVSDRRFSHVVWLLFLNLKHNIQHFFSGINVPFDCEFLVAQADGHTVILTEVYRISPSWDLQKFHFGNWTSGTGLNGPTITFYQRRNNLLGLVLKTAVMKTSTLTLADRNRKRMELSDFFAIVWKILQNQLKFKTKFFKPKDKSFGAPTQNGSWTGILGMLQREEVDFGCANFQMNSDRLDVVDYLSTLHHVKISLVIREPTTFHVSWLEILKPFSSRLWLVQIGVMAVVAIVFTVTYRLGRYYGSEDKEEPSYRSLHLAIFHTLAIFCVAAHDGAPRSLSCRTVYWTSFLTAVILLSGYSGSLISHLTIREIVMPFKSFKEFLQLGTYNLVYLQNSAYAGFLENATDPVLQEIYKKIVAPYEESLPQTTVQGLELVCSRETFAYMTYKEVLINKATPCSIVLVPHISLPASLSCITVKYSPYQEILNHKIHDMRVHGILKRLQNKLNKKILLSETPLPVVELVHVKSIITVLIAGVLAAIFLLLVELVSCKRVVLPVNEKDSYYYY